MPSSSLLISLCTIVSSIQLASAFNIPINTRNTVSVISRRADILGSTSLNTKGSGTSKAQTKGVQSNSVNDEEPFECSVTVTEADAQISWRPNFPNQLDTITWTGTGSVVCSTAMTAITLSIYATDAVGTRHLIGGGGECAECPEYVATTTNYKCQQAEFGGTCAGEWALSYEATVEAPPESPFESSSGSCVAEGIELTCSASVVAGTAKPYENANLPSGYVDDVQLDEGAIDDIRSFHFKGGAQQDNTKGLFFPTITDADLEAIFERGLLDTSAWTQSSTGNWKRTFPYAGVGVTSSGNPASNIDIFITPAGGTVSTMYPSS